MEKYIARNRGVKKILKKYWQKPTKIAESIENYRQEMHDADEMLRSWKSTLENDK